ncbi:MAG: NAD(P)/FAD-dependent oxidoreductase [Pseudomonadota bacterium]
MDTPFRIIVVGGGAGGLELVTKLGRTYKKRDDIEVMLVDQNYAHIWKPLLHEVAAGTLNSNDDELSYLAQAHWNHFEFRLGKLDALNRASKTITIAASYDDKGDLYIPAREVRYDILVIAVGSVTNDFSIEGVAEHCFFLDGRYQADDFHKFLVRSCYSANTQTEPLREGQLHIAIAGAGATGVELAAELHHSMHTLVDFGLQNIQLDKDLRIHLIEGSDRILPGLTEKISNATQEALASIGVKIHVNEFVSKADELGFHTKSGKFIPAEIKVWAAGIKGPDVLANLDGLEVNRINQLIVNEFLQSTQDDSIFALGDCAACPISDAEFAPPRAQAAHQQASTIAQSIAHIIKRDDPVKFSYQDFGSLINLSTTSTVGSLMGNLFGRQSGSIAIEGWFARCAYLSLYKMHQFAVQGLIRTCALTLANWITRSSKPRLKLH